MKKTLNFIYKALIYVALLIILILVIVVGVLLSPSLLSKKVRKAKSYKNFMLFVVAYIASLLINTISFIYTLFITPSIGYSKLWLNMAISEDQNANVKCSVPFNELLLSKEGKCIAELEFGNPDETISSNVGEAIRLTDLGNKQLLSKLGKDINKVLNFFEENHSIKSIEEQEI